MDTPLAIERRIHLLRGQRVMLDADLADLYGVATKDLNRAVYRNSERFPGDFMFRLDAAETTRLRCQIGASNAGRGGRRNYPLAFTEHGVAMLSAVLRSPRAIQVNIEIMRAFTRLRRILVEHQDLLRRLDAMEKRYDTDFKVVFQALRKLLSAPRRKKPQIGFRPA